MFAASIDRSLCVGGPTVCEVGSVTPQHGHIFKCRIEAAARGLVPVVCPRDLRVLTRKRERHGVSSVVVGETTLASVLDRGGGSTFDDYHDVSVLSKHWT